MGSSRRNWLAWGAAALAAVGCSKRVAPVAQVAPAPVSVATEPTPPVVAAEPPPKVEPTPSPAIRPTLPKPIVPIAAEPKPPEAPAVPEPVAQVPPPKAPELQPTKPEPSAPTNPPMPEPKKIDYPKEIDGKDLTWWIKQLNQAVQPDPQLRQLALRTLPQFGPEARKPSIAPVTNMIYADVEDPGVRIVAITIITNIGYETREQIKPVVAALRTCLAKMGNGSIVRLYCVRSLMSFGPEAVAAIAEIRTAGGDASWETRLAVAKALGQIGAPAGEKEKPNDFAAKYLLNTMLKDACAAVRLEAIHALLQMGPPKPKNPDDYAEEIKPYLEPLEVRVKVEKDKGVLCWLYLLNIMYDDHVLSDHLKKMALHIKAPDSPMVRLHAINACSALGSKAAPVIPQIADALHYAEPELVAAAIYALAQIGTEARGTVAELEKIKAGSKDPVKPPDAPKDWKPDTTLRAIAAEAILYITGKKKLGDSIPKKDK